MSEPMIIAIDGPAGAGKSTVGRRLAERLGVEYLDTGAMYRAVTLAALERGVEIDDPEAVAAVARAADIDLDHGIVRVDGVDATAAVRSAAVTARVSEVAANSAVRAELVERQRRWVNERGGAVVEGRDIGSVVFPDALLKLFITASPRVRAERRVAQDRGVEAADVTVVDPGAVDAVEAAIIERDRADSSRADSPLTTTPDMVVVDTSGLSIDEVVGQIIDALDATGDRAVPGQDASVRNGPNPVDGPNPIDGPKSVDGPNPIGNPIGGEQPA